MILTHSPSSLALARSCRRSWALKYLYKIYPESDLTRGKTLGTLIHASLELYLRGGKLTDLSVRTLTQDQAKDVQKYYLNRVNDVGEEKANDELATLFREAPQRALAGVDYIPKPNDIEWHDVESTVVIDTTPLIGRQIKFSPRSRIDWVGKLKSGRIKVIDHKSTVGKPNAPWCYVPQLMDLLSGDPQLVIYTYYVMQRFGVDEVDFEFVYYYTGEGLPQAKNLPFVLKRDFIERQLVKQWLPLCDELQALADEHSTSPINIGLLPAPADLISNQSPCRKFRGCPYHNVQCHPPVVTREQILAHIAPQKKETVSTMNQTPNPSSVAGMLAGPPPMSNPVPLHVAPVGYAGAPQPNAPLPASPFVAPVAPYFPPDVPVAVNTPPYGEVPPAASYGVPLPAGQAFPHVAGAIAAHAAAPALPPALPEPTPPAAEKPRRTRRTKVEIEAAAAESKIGLTEGEVAAFDDAMQDVPVADNFGTEGTIPTLHTADPLEALLWAVRKSGGKVTITVEL